MVRKVKAGRLSYEIDVHRKITVIVGGSGQGKTSFARTIERMLLRNQAELRQYFGEPLMLVRPMAETQALNALNGYVGFDIGVIDCDVFRLTDELADAINKTPLPFILISREKISSIPVHYDSVYRLIRCDDGVHRSVCLYNPKLGIKRNIPTFIEDSDVGYRFYRRILGSGFIMPSLVGFSSIPRRLNEAMRAELSMHGEFQLIADAATFGCCCGDIDDLNRVTCFLPECFEEVIAMSEIFGRFRPARQEDPLSIEALRYMSMERYYDKEVSRVLSEQAHTSYRKGSGRSEKCIFGDCMKCMKRPSSLMGNDSCRFFSLYEKDNTIMRAVDEETGQLKFETTSGYVLVGQDFGIEHKTQVDINGMLTTAVQSNPISLRGKIPETQIWAESGKLHAVKVKDQWHVII